MKKIIQNFSLLIVGLLSIVNTKIASAAILPNTDPTTWHLDPTNPVNDIVNIVIHNATSIALSLAGGIAVALIIYAGFMYMTAYGNEARATQAKNIMLWAVVGVVVIIVSTVIYNEIVSIVH